MSAGRRPVVVYGDFNCPYSYLASLRVDRLLDNGVDVEWRAVEHDRSMSVTGEPTSSRHEEWVTELADVEGLAMDDEALPSHEPSVLSSTRAAVSVYAESVSDGLERRIRERLFEEIWVQQHNISSAYVVRRVVTDEMYPPVPLQRYRSTEIATPVCGDRDGDRITRRLGGTVAPDGGPLTSAGYWRIRRWREEWSGFPEPVVPTVVDSDGGLHQGVAGLRRLAELAFTAVSRTRDENERKTDDRTAA